MHPRPTALLLAALALLAPAAALAPPPPPPVVVLHGTIASDQTHEGVAVLVAGDLEVAPGATLRLRGANVTVLSLQQRPLAVAIQPGGAVVLEDGADAATGAPGGTRLASIGHPFALSVAAGGTLVAANATVRDARIAIAGAASLHGSRINLSAGGLDVAGGALVVRGGVLESSPDPLVHVAAGSADVEDALLRGAGAEALRAQAGTQVRLAGSRIEGAGAYGVSLWGAQAHVEGNDFASALDYALRADGTTLVFRGNAVDNHCAVFLNGGTTGAVEDNTLAIGNHGITVRDSGVVRVANNTITGGTQGIALVDSAPGLVEGNTVRGHNLGILIRRGGAHVANNTIADNDRGLLVTDEPDPDAVVLRDNAFTGNAQYAARNDRAAPQDARWNWWGSPAGPGGAQALVGPWDAAPWRTAAP